MARPPLSIQQTQGLSNSTTPATTFNYGQFATSYPIGPAIGTSAVQQLVNARLNANQLKTYTFPSDLPKYHFVIIENEWTYTGGLRAEKMFKLPLPTPLTDAMETNFDTNFNYLGGVIEALTRVAGAPAAVGQAAGAGLGLTLNQFKTVTLSAPDYRTFELTWKLAPKNFSEAQTTRRITHALRKGMSPRKTAGVGRVLLQFPKIYTMYFSPNPKYLFKFKPCVLSTLVVDYAGGNPFPAFYKPNVADPGLIGDDPGYTYDSESPPEAMVVSTKWIELEYWLAEDFVDRDDIPTNNPFENWNFYGY